MTRVQHIQPDKSAFPSAPFHADVADAPKGAFAAWAMAADGVKIRLGMLSKGKAGTIFLLPGRTEYIEKYGRTASDFLERGYGMVSIDWRGQGLSERLLDDPLIGHVEDFLDYQKDLAQLRVFALAQDMPRPWYMIAHSMGGAIGLRALDDRFDVQACAFSAPLWGLQMNGVLRPVAWGLSWLGHKMAWNGLITPSTSRQTYVSEAPRSDNMLTHDPDMMDYMKRHLDVEPGLHLGGPSIPWLYRTLAESRDLVANATPQIPTLTFVPELEYIVSTDAMFDTAKRWPLGDTVVVPGGKHETMMETPERRQLFLDRCVALFEQNA
ncbi:alpha/beta fold hydrolase [Qingshengfaniella alkalisoli]|uniref:Alpha/beta hydrolase n=1 Tax=Qingshengfaniella alkalisoli TaxID=2599296 RepID=A0A5B8I6R5_9RHOB|nr:alpha/beta hydrolase [Qingshengfaniella alkalisoli]QDY69265.1 alpha/beta hydrolase [Qingshengfaniella alkalisoli]